MAACTDCVAPPVEGRKRCDTHLSYYREKAASYRAANPERVKQTQRDNNAKRWAELTDEERAEKNERERQRQGKENGRGHWRAKMKWRYGLSEDDFWALYEAQLGACAICKTPFPSTEESRRPCVDHCHATGAVRGLLCDHCNNGLGRFADNPARLRAAAAYLEG